MTQPRLGASSPEAVQLHALTERLFDAIRAKDGPALESMVAPDCVFRIVGAAPMNRDGFLRAVTDAPYTVESIRGHGVTVYAYPNTAVVFGVQEAQVTLPGDERVTDRVAFTDVFERRDGRWWLVSSFTSAVADVAGSPAAPDTPSR